MSEENTPTRRIGFFLVRFLVPLWVFAGVAMKLWEKSPKLLPRNIWSTAVDLGINLYWLLATLIALELLAVAVMLFLPRLARPMAIFMLASFCLILIGEIAVGNTACGCLGAYSPSPWSMLAIDGSLLLGVLLFARSPSGPLVPTGRGLPTLAWIVSGFVLCAVSILPEDRDTALVAPGAGVVDPVDGHGSETPDGSATPAPSPARAQLPGYFVPAVGTWPGKAFADLDLVQFMARKPTEYDRGLRYVVFYSKSCDHCQTLFQRHFFASPVPTTIVAIPESKAGFNRATWLQMECPGCEELELPVGADWIITTPIVVALENGTVICAKEGESPDAPECLVWH